MKFVRGGKVSSVINDSKLTTLEGASCVKVSIALINRGLCAQVMNRLSWCLGSTDLPYITWKHQNKPLARILRLPLSLVGFCPFILANSQHLALLGAITSLIDADRVYHFSLCND